VATRALLLDLRIQVGDVRGRLLDVEGLPCGDLCHQVIVREALPRQLSQPHPSHPVVCHYFN
jgi:hypothetical protein